MAPRWICAPWHYRRVPFIPCTQPQSCGAGFSLQPGLQPRSGRRLKPPLQAKARATYLKLALAALLLPLMGAAAGVSIQFEGGVFKVAGWRAGAEPAGGWPSIFTIRTETDKVWSEQPPILFGSYAVVDGMLTFTPRFPMVPAVTYHAVFRLAGEAPVEARFGGLPLAPGPQT